MLDEAQEKLEAHFTSLSRLRAPLGYPVYAFEHGLSTEQTDALRQALVEELRTTRWLHQTHWLAWLITATEVGYAYDGDEYWDTFTEAVPTWRICGKRGQIRTWFLKFAQTYNGFRPHGRWADHFRIIAWPITHAILPRDLQGQFASRIYDLRYELARRPDRSIDEIGNLLRRGAVSGSSRFQHLLEQPELTGRLVLALRDEDVKTPVPSLYPPTLARIVHDLEQRRTARDWLRDARTVLRAAKIRAATSLAPRTTPPPERTQGSIGAHSPEGARLIARQSADGNWHLGAALPDLAKSLAAAQISSKHLGENRIRFADRLDNWMPARALLGLSKFEQPIISLRKVSETAILQLEQSTEPLATLLANQLHLRGSAPWLLRIHEDGVARHIAGNHVRSGQNYLFVSWTALDPHPVSELGLELVGTSTNDATVYILRLPRQISSNVLSALDTLRIGYVLRATIRPAGLVPRWDATTGASVWLVSEEPVLHLSADCPVTQFTLQVDQQEPITLTANEKGEALVSLGPLGIGPHVVEVGGRNPIGSRPTDQLESERLLIEVRSPVPWLQGVRDRAGFKIVLDPSDASLDQLLGGRANLALVGPAGRGVQVELRTFNVNGHLATSIDLGRTSFGDTATLRQLIAKIGKEPISEAIQSAPRIDLAFIADQLGVDALSFPHKVQPLRWKLTKHEGAYRARLIDEAGADQAVEVYRYDIECPDKAVKVDLADCLAGIAVQAPGALFTAKFAKHHYPAVISAPAQLKLQGLKQLGIQTSLSTGSEAPRSIVRLTYLHRLWRHAPGLGPLGALRKAEVLKAIEQRIATIMCGETWARRAQECTSERDPNLERLRQDVGGSPGFGARMRSTDWSHRPTDSTVISEFSRLAKTYRIADDSELCRLALRLAFTPGAVKFDDPDTGIAALERLAQVPALTRGAYLARLVTDFRARDGFPESGAA